MLKTTFCLSSSEMRPSCLVYVQGCTIRGIAKWCTSISLADMLSRPLAVSAMWQEKWHVLCEKESESVKIVFFFKYNFNFEMLC